MDKGKGLIIAIGVFLLIGIGTFVFANRTEKEFKDNDTSITDSGGSTKKDTQNKKTDKTDTNEKDNNVKEATSVYSVKTNASKRVNGNSTNENVVTEVKVNSPSTSNDNATQDAYGQVLMAVQKAEETLLQEDKDNASSLVNTLEESTNKDDLTNRLGEVQNTIDVINLIEELSVMVNDSLTKEDIDAARYYRIVNNIDEKVNLLKEDNPKKVDLFNKLQELAKVLDDESAPIINGVEDGTVTSDNVLITIEDDNEVKIMLNGSEVTIDDITVLIEEGEYQLTVTDSAFNNAIISFVIDKTSPIISGIENGTITNSNVSGIVEDNSDVQATLNGEEVKLEDLNNITDEGVYELIIKDAAQNETVVNFTIDKTVPTAEIEYSTTETTTEDVTASLVNPSEEINILNNNGLNTYTFTENGEFAFIFADIAGNQNTLVAKVENITKTNPDLLLGE